MMPTLMRHRKVLAHAEQQLRSGQAELDRTASSAKSSSRSGTIALVEAPCRRRYCDLRRARALVDIVLSHLPDAAIEEPDGRVADVRSAGGDRRLWPQRAEPFSDVTLFLHPDASKAEAQVNETQQILYMLWDVGFSGGLALNLHDVKQANADMLETSLLRGALVASDQPLFDHPTTRSSSTASSATRMHASKRVENQAERHARNGQTVYLRPNIKNSCAACYYQASLMTFAARWVRPPTWQEGPAQ